MNININNNYNDPNLNNIEIIERKGMGHPDTLADKLAEECSRAYSQYCMEHFGCVLHHNFDKLYIGAGCFRYENKTVNMYDKVKVYLNGRASNTMNGELIDIEKILTPVIKKYLSSVLPRLDVEKELEIHCNCTQNTKINRWFSPQNIDDVPDAKNVFANDTSVCVGYYPLTYCENLVLLVEQFFWKYENYYPTPRFKDIGQDIKVMLSRIGKNVTLSISMPVYSDCFNTKEEYEEIIAKYEYLLYEYIKKIDNTDGYNIDIGINSASGNDYRIYSLIKGSCIECGEEGVVGRGNNSQGIISVFREHTMEAPSGKNERYHTGRVLSFLSERAIEKIANECNLKGCIYVLTRNGNDLLNPFLCYININKELSKEQEEIINNILNEEFNHETYLNKVLAKRKMV